ncbi:LPS export ABC transporter permease LptF [Hasllibacter sp. MH4015]|uniref:LPS export ABC transporter permease LptF n=1 Tax=Hasllibacter sp. MH4015 TaxID=2854029 RepID=UPI001CD35C21|nr:LPS export ABC transporter permease LptF [Hasllibacter sp. MH4015]
MGQFDKYILRQLVMLFGFFSLVLVSVYWVNQAARLFDSLIADGQNVGVFLEFSALTLPWIIQLILPVAAFVATLYIFNRMIGESEMVVLQTAGLSALRLLRPVFYFGILMALLVGVLGNVLAPAARSQFMMRQDEVRDDLTGKFLRAGEFIHPTAGLTVYIREISDLGEFQDIFLQDATNPGVEVTYTATNALLVRSDTGPRLVMFDGVAQTLDLETGRLGTVQFSDFTYDVGGLINPDTTRRVDVREVSTPTLLRADAQMAEELNLPLAHMVFEGHDRIAQSLFVIFVPLIGAASLMLGTFSRFGVWKQVLIAVALVLPMQIVRNAGEAAVRADADAWLMAYAQPAVAAIVAAIMVALAMRRRQGWRGIPA